MKNIVFDLGNVVIDIDFPKTYIALAELSAAFSEKEVERVITEQNLWVNYEMGHYTDAEFRDLLRSHLSIEATDEAIDQAFSALLLNIEPERIALIKSLRSQYKTFVLSNTSNIHIIDVERILYKCTGERYLNDLFDKVFLSYEMGKVKPHVSIYQQLLDEAGLEASETLFLDDKLENLEGAAQLGIQVAHIIPNQYTILDVFGANSK
jgi:epoxide hydrolase-like predicted phosphatase